MTPRMTPPPATTKNLAKARQISAKRIFSGPICRKDRKTRYKTTAMPSLSSDSPNKQMYRAFEG